MSGYAVDRQETNLVWQLTGCGFDHLGLYRLPKPTITGDQLLVRQEVVTICFSSVKVILLGNTHPRLQGRCLSRQPVVLGDEAFVSVVEVGRNLCHRFKVGEGYAIFPDLGTGAFGYDIDGGLKRYNVLEGKILDTLLPIEQETVTRVGMFAVSLSEPLGCVEKSYRLVYRRGLEKHGRLLLAGTGADRGEAGDLLLHALAQEIATRRPREIVAVNVPDKLAVVLGKQARALAIDLTCSPTMESLQTRAERSAEHTFDDIILLGGGQSGPISQVARETTGLLARGGILNLVGHIPRGTPLPVDIGRTHYDKTLVVGTAGPDFLPAYQANTDYELKAGGVVVFVGAGGPMGQLHLLRAMGMARPPAKIIAVEVEPARLKKLDQWQRFVPPGIELLVMNPKTQDIAEVLAGDLIDYLVLLSPAAQVIEDYTRYLAPKAVINAFAGLKGQHITLDAALICQKHLRVVGHSGADRVDQQLALEQITRGRVSVNPVVSAVGGIHAAWDALWATYNSTYPGKIALYLGLDLPLTPIEAVTGGAPWSAEYERKLFLSAGRPPQIMP